MVRFSLLQFHFNICAKWRRSSDFSIKFFTDISVEAHFHEVDKSTIATVFQLLFPIELQLHSLKRYLQQFHHSQGSQIDKIQKQNVRIEALHYLCNILWRTWIWSNVINVLWFHLWQQTHMLFIDYLFWILCAFLFTSPTSINREVVINAAVRSGTPMGPHIWATLQRFRLFPETTSPASISRPHTVHHSLHLVLVY